MNVWTNNQFSGHWPVGTAAVVVAGTALQAAELLNNELSKCGLGRPATPDQFEKLSTNAPTVRVLCDGDY